MDHGVIPGTVIGKALMGLTSVLDISVFKGRVKALTMDRERFCVGEEAGSRRSGVLYDLKRKNVFRKFQNNGMKFLV